jgi:hypothetical protein
MNQFTRALIAAAAAEKVMGHPVDRLYDHTEGVDVPVRRHLLPAAQPERDVLVLFRNPAQCISIQVHDDLFSGWDDATGTYFAGALYDSNVMLYDAHERRYYKFSIH